MPRLLFKGDVYFFGIYTSLAEYKKLVKKTNKRTTTNEQQQQGDSNRHGSVWSEGFSKFWAFWYAIALVRSDTHMTLSLTSHEDCPPCLKKYYTLCNISLGTWLTLNFPLFMHAVKQSWLFPSSIDTESTSPSRCNTDNDADPFTKSEDDQELEVNETVLEYC